MTKQEPEGNLQMVCPDCIEKRKEEVQATLQHMTLEVDDMIKLPFKCADEMIENMWCKILDPAGKTAQLDNIPVFCTNYILGQIIQYKKEDIKDFMREPNG